MGKVLLTGMFISVQEHCVVETEAFSHQCRGSGAQVGTKLSLMLKRSVSLLDLVIFSQYALFKIRTL